MVKQQKCHIFSCLFTFIFSSRTGNNKYFRGNRSTVSLSTPLLTVFGVVWCILVWHMCVLVHNIADGMVRSLPQCWIWWSRVNTFLGTLRKSASVRRSGSKSRNACFRHNGLNNQSPLEPALENRASFKCTTWACLGFIDQPDCRLTRHLA